ncbi:MAG: sensor histidine kinase, partial [Clostridium sp.]
MIVIFLLASLDFYFIKKELANIEKNTLYINEKVVYDVNEEINNINNTTNLIIKNMYNDKRIVKDILDFLEMDEVEYLKHKLDLFSSSKDYFYKGIESFTRDSFNINESLINISFISYEKEEVRTF